MNAPRLANGPYMPTDAPKLIEAKFVSVVSKPVRTGILLLPVCAAKMTYRDAVRPVASKEHQQAAHDQATHDRSQHREPREKAGHAVVVARVGSNQQLAVDPSDALDKRL